MRRRHRLEEGASQELLLPGNPGNLDYGRPPRGRLFAVDYRTIEHELRCVFSSDFEKMYLVYPGERCESKVIAEVQATSWRLRDCIRVRELVATHRLEKMHRLRMLEEQKAWKREAGFDIIIEVTAEMDEQRLRPGFDL